MYDRPLLPITGTEFLSRILLTNANQCQLKVMPLTSHIVHIMSVDVATQELWTPKTHKICRFSQMEKKIRRKKSLIGAEEGAGLIVQHQSCIPVLQIKGQMEISLL